MANWEKFQPQKPDSITEGEWQTYLNTDPAKDPELRDKVEKALGWKEGDIAAAREIAERVLGAVTIADSIAEVRNLGHVPDENLFRYRNKMRLSRQLKSLGDTIGANDPSDSTVLWRMAKKYRDQAQELRADIPRKEDGDGDHDVLGEAP